MSKITNNENDTKKNILNLKKTFLIALKTFEQNYINYNLNNDNDEYKNIFFTSKSQLQELNTNLFNLTNQIKNKILSNHKKNHDEIKSLKESKEMYNVTINKLQNVGDESRASNILIDDYQDMYDKQFYKNFQIIIGIFALSFITYKMKNI
jgi:hypothetical protein